MSSCRAILLLLTLSALTAACFAQTWDARRDFAPSNPNGAWSYGSGVTGTSFTLYATYLTSCDAAWGTQGLVCWSGNLYYYAPLVAADITPQWLFCCYGVVVPPDALVVHPAPDWEPADSIVQWTAPADGTYSIYGYFEILDAVSPTGIIGLVYRNGTPLFRGELLGPPAQPPNRIGGRENFVFPELALQAGDIISFGVNADGTFYYDSTGFNAVISTPPSAPPCALCSQSGGLHR
ncbi:MAG TPA: hypothetical protein VKB58_04525 [Terriglobales bacterium]|nr:hypothetical protein [Terriglobales bacterium]